MDLVQSRVCGSALHHVEVMCYCAVKFGLVSQQVLPTCVTLSGKELVHFLALSGDGFLLSLNPCDLHLVRECVFSVHVGFRARLGQSKY